MISQLTVFIENEKGHLARVCRTIADAGINMRAMFLADTEDFGIARIFCDTPELAEKALSDAGYRAKIVPVVGVRVPDRQGGLAELLEFLDSKDINVEYGYCFSVNEEFAVDVLKIDYVGITELLEEQGYILVKDDELYEVG
ncbi:MAG: amino acid-binding protein [Raoultibacter sp.]|jgi:hypothetical protein